MSKSLLKAKELQFLDTKSSESDTHKIQSYLTEKQYKSAFIEQDNKKVNVALSKTEFDELISHLIKTTPNEKMAVALRVLSKTFLSEVINESKKIIAERDNNSNSTSFHITPDIARQAFNRLMNADKYNCDNLKLDFLNSNLEL